MMALPATAADPSSGTATTHEEQHGEAASTANRPASPAAERSRNYTPSVSPLSTSSRTHTLTHAQTDDQLRQSPTPNPANLRKGSISDLSEPPDLPDDDDDVSSSLSDFDENSEHRDQTPKPPNEDVDDSEAETERLQQTPQNKIWKSQELGKTPSKLNQEMALEQRASSPSRLPNRNSVSPSPDGGALAAGSKKRKRPTSASPVVGSPLSDHMHTKRTPSPPKFSNGSLGAAQNSTQAQDDDDAHGEVRDDDSLAPEPEPRGETPELEPEEENPYISPMKAARLKRGKQKAAQKLKETPVPQKQDERPAADESGDLDDMHEDDDSAARSDEDRENKKRALDAFTSIAEQFHAFRIKLHAERLAAVDTELQQLSSPLATHPEYLAMLQTITNRRDVKIHQEGRYRHYKLKALHNQVVGERAILLGQFFQQARELRDQYLSDLGKQYSDIQKERRQAQTDQVPKYMAKFPTDRLEQVRYQTQYNKEVSILSGVQRYQGFPAAPDIAGARPSELDNDFKDMKIPPTRRPPHAHQRQHQHQHQHQHPPVYHHNPVQQPQSLPASARTAEEKFLEQTPWANPQHPYHQHARTPVSFGPYSGPNHNGNQGAINFLRQGAVQHQQPYPNHSPFSTPLPHPQRQVEQQANGLGSNDTIGIPSDPPSSAVAAPPTSDRMHPNAREDGSPIDHVKARPAMANPFTSRPGAEAKRDFSNISSASTIDSPADAQDPHPRHHGPYGALPTPLPAGTSAPHSSFMSSALHGNPAKDERKQPEHAYENVGFRPQMGAFGQNMPLFANAGSPPRKEGQKAT